MADSFNLRDHSITVAQVQRNLPLGALYEREASIVDNGALAACSGVKTGRSPKDKRLVKHPDSQADVWWGPVNIPIEPSTFATSPTKKRAMSKSCIAESIKIPALQRIRFASIKGFLLALKTVRGEGKLLSTSFRLEIK